MIRKAGTRNPATKRCRQVIITLTRHEYESVREIAVSQSRKPSGLVLDLVMTLLRNEGRLTPLKRPEDFEEGIDAYRFPWSPPPKAGTFPPRKLKWVSTDPLERSWAKLFDDIETKSGLNLRQICKDYDVSVVHAGKVWRKYDTWRRGDRVYPPLDPFAGLRNKTKARRKRAKKEKQK